MVFAGESFEMKDIISRVFPANLLADVRTN